MVTVYVANMDLENTSLKSQLQVEWKGLIYV